jgi:hypothetical protein
MRAALGGASFSGSADPPVGVQLPWQRTLLGYDRQLCSAVMGAFVKELTRSYERRAKRLLGLASGTILLCFRLHSAFQKIPHTVFEHQTPDEVYFGCGRHMPGEFALLCHAARQQGVASRPHTLRA